MVEEKTDDALEEIIIALDKESDKLLEMMMFMDKRKFYHERDFIKVKERVASKIRRELEMKQDHPDRTISFKLMDI